MHSCIHSFLCVCWLQGYALSDYDIEILMRKIDIDHDGNVNLSEFMATLIDWNQMQANSNFKVRAARVRACVRVRVRACACVCVCLTST
jgi:hypothetical protein